MRKLPVLPILCTLAVSSCARPIAVKVTTTPVSGVELTLNRSDTEFQSAETSGADKTNDSAIAGAALRRGYSQCVFENVPQGRDLTIIARKEGYEVTSFTVPAKAAPMGFALLWSPRAWSSLIWSKESPRAKYLTLEDEEHRMIDLQEEGVIIEMKPIPNGNSYTPSPMPPFDDSMMKNS